MPEGGVNRASVFFGTFFLVAGAAFLLDRIGVFGLRIRYLLPALVIAAGAGLVSGIKARPGSRH